VNACPSCGAGLEGVTKFCPHCGTLLERECSSCGAPGQRGRFCGDCGTPLTGAAPAGTATPSSGAVRSAPVAERRVTSVLFGDLVGFTPLSESRDAEEVRELLSR
jgi:predicted amidophosphoribosyltransferase